MPTALPKRTNPLRLVLVALAIALVATACGSDTIEPAAGIETNDGGITIKPPDVLEGNPEPTPIPATELPPKVEGALDTPVVSFRYFDGTAGSTTDFAGKPTVLNFWASTCAACIAEMPDFEEAHLALDGQVSFIGVNTADRREAADELAAQTGVTYPLVEDPGSDVFRAFRGFVMPTTVLLNPQGQVAFTWSGVLTAEELRILIDEHIAPGSNSDV